MSQGNILQGQASGKLGDTVLMVRNGTQVARVYTTSGARSGDAASHAARLQRVRFGSASNEWQLYRYICTRMFRKGRTTNQSDYNYFVKRNVDNLPYLTKLENADGVCCMMPGQFSEGTLGRIELISAYVQSGETPLSVLAIKDSINTPTTRIAWTDTIDALKEELKLQYSSARKVTYLLVATSINQFSEGEQMFESQFFAHYPVIIDLYAETVPGEGEMQIKTYFARYVSDAKLKTLINGQTATFQSDSMTFGLWALTSDDNATVESCGALIFATNDLVSDCYTTILPAVNVNPSRGVYKVWASYRTENALQVAADSYGYQSGVMRDAVAANDSVDSAQALAYAKSVISLGREAAESFVNDLEAANSPAARAARALIED